MPQQFDDSFQTREAEDLAGSVQKFALNDDVEMDPGDVDAEEPQKAKDNDKLSPIDDLQKGFESAKEEERSRITEPKQVQSAGDRSTKLNDEVEISSGFKLRTPVPADLVPILAKDRETQRLSAENARRESQDRDAPASVDITKYFEEAEPPKRTTPSESSAPSLPRQTSQPRTTPPASSWSPEDPLIGGIFTSSRMSYSTVCGLNDFDYEGMFSPSKHRTQPMSSSNQLPFGYLRCDTVAPLSSPYVQGNRYIASTPFAPYINESYPPIFASRRQGPSQFVPSYLSSSPHYTQDKSSQPYVCGNQLPPQPYSVRAAMPSSYLPSPTFSQSTSSYDRTTLSGNSSAVFGDVTTHNHYYAPQNPFRPSLQPPLPYFQPGSECITTSVDQQEAFVNAVMRAAELYKIAVPRTPFRKEPSSIAQWAQDVLEAHWNATTEGDSRSAQIEGSVGSSRAALAGSDVLDEQIAAIDPWIWETSFDSTDQSIRH